MPEEISLDEAFKLMTGTSIFEASRCEWDPENDQPSPELGGGCRNEATVVVGSKGEWHLCKSCAERDVFKRYRTRKVIR